MLEHNDLEQAFGNSDEIGDATYRCRLATTAHEYCNYFRLDAGRAGGSDIAAVSQDRNDDSFALAIFGHIPLSFRSDHLSILDIPPIGVGFDALLLAPPAYHKLLKGAIKGALDDKRKDLVLCIPIHRCEFSGTESPDEFYYLCYRNGSADWTDDWSHAKRPKILARFYNPKLDYGTPHAGAFMQYATLLHTLGYLTGVVGGFLEVMNYRGQRLYIRPMLDESFLVGNELDQERLDQTSVRNKLKAFLTK